MYEFAPQFGLFLIFIFLVSYYTKLNVSTSVESIIFVLKKITALKKRCANLTHSPLYDIAILNYLLLAVHEYIFFKVT